MSQVVTKAKREPAAVAEADATGAGDEARTALGVADGVEDDVEEENALGVLIGAARVVDPPPNRPLL